MTNVIKQMFPHTFRLRRQVGESGGEYIYEDVFTSMCSAQIKSVEGINDQARYTIICPYQNPQNFVGERAYFHGELTMFDRTMTKGYILNIDNTKIYTYNGIAMGCVLDVIFRDTVAF